jgi:hypothetical protein
VFCYYHWNISIKGLEKEIPSGIPTSLTQFFPAIHEPAAYRRGESDNQDSLVVPILPNSWHRQAIALIENRQSAVNSSN